MIMSVGDILYDYVCGRHIVFITFVRLYYQIIIFFYIVFELEFYIKNFVCAIFTFYMRIPKIL
jgi:hypothetical protein